jgi:hypothetical protein
MSIARSIMTLAEAQHGSDNHRRTYFAAALLAVSVPTVDQRTVAGCVVYAYADQSFLALGGFENLDVAALEFTELSGPTPMAAKWEVLERELPAILKAREDGQKLVAMLREGIGGMLDAAANRGAAQAAAPSNYGVPTGAVPRPSCNDPDCLTCFPPKGPR